MSGDRPRSEYRREVEQAEEASRSSQGTGGRSWGADFVPFGWPTLPSRGRNERAVERGQAAEGTGTRSATDYERERGRGGGRRRTGEGTWLDEGLITLLLVAGVALFLFPEPGTSAVGLVLIGAGVLAWIVDLAT